MSTRRPRSLAAAAALSQEVPSDSMPIGYVTDLTPALWIRGRLHPFAQDVGSIVPEGFEDYARVFHPARAADGRAVTWRAIAEANGGTVHAEMQFGNIAGTWRESAQPDVWTHTPHAGSLTPQLASDLVEVLRAHTRTAQQCFFAVWEGWGGFDPGTPRFEHPNRRYFLAAGSLDDAKSTVLRDRWMYQSASMWWPDDRSWFVATEVDFEYTYIGGTPNAIDAVLAHAQIEALRVRLSDGITIASDRLNPAPAPLVSPRPSLLRRLRGLLRAG